MQFQVMHKYLLEMVFMDWSQLKGVHSGLKGILKKLVTSFVKTPIIYSMVWESHVKYWYSWQLIMI